MRGTPPIRSRRSDSPCRDHTKSPPDVQEHLICGGTNRPMPYPADHRERTRERIVRSARVLFNRHGFDRVSIDDVMKHAGLTRGGFYRHFDSKSDLYAEAISFAIADTPWSRWDGVDVDFSAADAAQQ